MTRRTLAQFRKNKGPDKWVAIKDEFDKFPSAPGDNYAVAGGTGTVYAASPATDPINTGLTSVTGFGISVMSPVTPDYIAINCTPIAGKLYCSTTPADTEISWFAVGEE